MLNFVGNSVGSCWKLLEVVFSFQQLPTEKRKKKS